jgi:hypothetical protein
LTPTTPTLSCSSLLVLAVVAAPLRAIGINQTNGAQAQGPLERGLYTKSVCFLQSWTMRDFSELGK